MKTTLSPTDSDSAYLKHLKGRKVVIVVGAGFAGLRVATELKNHPNLHVILIDQKNHHLFQPLLYQVATAGLNPADIAAPIRAQFSRVDNVSVHLAKVHQVSLRNQTVSVQYPGKVLGELTTIHFDYLILACGVRHSYFGHPEWEAFAPGLKSIEQATEIRRRFLSAFERAENELNPERQKELLTFVVVGGGPTGVELAGAMADITKTVISDDFRLIDPRRAQVILLEAGPRLLSSFDEKLSSKAAEDLRELGVEVRTSAKVEHIGPEGVVVNGELIASESIFWAAGVEVAKINLDMDCERDRSGRFVVGEDLSIPGFANVFVVGDMAHAKDATGGVIPGLAPVAIQQGRFAAQTIRRDLAGKKRKPFIYIDKGIMATIGKHRAIAQSGKIRLTGLLAWIAWLFVHVLYLIGFKNRVSVFAQWVWSYLFSRRGARLITKSDWKNEA